MNDPIDKPETVPVLRGDCASVEKPCPWTRCRHHVFHKSDRDAGVQLSRMRKQRETDRTCTLDMADRGGSTRAEVAAFLGIGFDRVTDIEATALSKARRIGIRLGLG